MELGTYSPSEEAFRLSEESGTERTYFAVYPEDSSKEYPLVLMVNGTGVPFKNTRTSSASSRGGDTWS